LPITTKIGWKQAWGMGIPICSNKGTGSFWGPLRGKIRKTLVILKNLLWYGTSFAQGDVKFFK